MTTFFSKNRREAELEAKHGPIVGWTPAEQTCRCNRPNHPAHCHECGSAFIYVKMSGAKLISMAEQPTQRVKMFHCRRCGANFHEDSACGAPLKVAGATANELRAARAAAKAQRVPTQSDLARGAEKLARYLADKYPQSPLASRMALPSATSAEPQVVTQTTNQAEPEPIEIADDDPTASMSPAEKAEFERWRNEG